MHKSTAYHNFAVNDAINGTLGLVTPVMIILLTFTRPEKQKKMTLRYLWLSREGRGRLSKLLNRPSFTIILNTKLHRVSSQSIHSVIKTFKNDHGTQTVIDTCHTLGIPAKLFQGPILTPLPENHPPLPTHQVLTTPDQGSCNPRPTMGHQYAGVGEGCAPHASSLARGLLPQGCH